MDARPAKDLDVGDCAPAFTHLFSHLRFWVIAVIVFWFDLWSKSWAFTVLGPSEARPAFGHLLEFRRSINAGAVFGFFKGQVGLFIVASLFAFGFVFYLFATSARTQRVLHLALGLILAGALGNLYDRAVMKADVLEFRDPAHVPPELTGKITSNSDKYIHIGQWPEGRNAQRVARADVDIRSQGVVRDFIKFVPRFPSWVPRFGGRDIWPWVFNIADTALVCGVGALLFTSSLKRRALPAP